MYTFGYPLSATLFNKAFTAGQTVYCPRVTAAIIASITIATSTVVNPANELDYLLDRASVSGNSGGPVVDLTDAPNS